MKDSHISLRLPESLDRALAAAATSRSEPKSNVVREAVATYLGLAESRREPNAVLLASEFVALWSARPALTEAERIAFADDIDDARRTLREPDDPWA